MKAIIYNENCLDTMKRLKDNSIDIVFTSPPYAEQRNNTYGGISEESYIEWFIPIAHEIKRVLKPTGSFFLNIKSHVKEGERSLYVFKLIIALREQLDFYFIDDFAWIKNPYPGGYYGRFKNAHEPIFHFIKSDLSNIKFNPLICGSPILEESKLRSKRKSTGYADSGSGMGGVKQSNIADLAQGRPSNVIIAHNVLNQFSKRKFHPAVFPISLPTFFIKSFSDKSDLIYDPFSGSGTTGIASLECERNFIGSEIVKDYCDKANRILGNTIVQRQINF